MQVASEYAGQSGGLLLDGAVGSLARVEPGDGEIVAVSRGVEHMSASASHALEIARDAASGAYYAHGGAGPSGFDCSGFTMYVYAQVGISLPHNAAMQYGMGSPVGREFLQPGDLVFFNGLGHVGLYIGGGQFIHAPHTGDVVKISSLTGWYASTYVGARRF